MRIIDAIAKAEGARAAFFIQPAPAIGKKLTDEEKGIVGSLSYGPLYARLAAALLETRTAGLQVFSLLDVFRDTRDTVYGDPTHFARDAKTMDSIGNRIVASTMANRLATVWSLERTCPGHP